MSDKYDRLKALAEGEHFGDGQRRLLTTTLPEDIRALLTELLAERDRLAHDAALAWLVGPGELLAAERRVLDAAKAWNATKAPHRDAELMQAVDALLAVEGRET